MNEIIGECRRLFQESSFAKDNLSMNETLALLLEKQEVRYDPIILPNLTKTQRELLLGDFERVLSGYPLGYVTGFTWFYKWRFKTLEEVLIPRCDSEVLVDQAVKLIPKGAHFLDLCTGTGCLGISVLLERPDTTATLIDISEKAVKLAQSNAEALGVSQRCRAERLDILLGGLPSHDAIIMNPPYLTKAEMADIPENVSFEPTLALFGGDDGLDFYRRFANESTLCIFEIGSKQTQALLDIFPDGRVVFDLSRNPRVFIKPCDKSENHFRM